MPCRPRGYVLATISKRNRSKKSRKSSARQTPSPASQVNAAIPGSPDERFSSVTIQPKLKGSRRRDPNLIPIGSRTFPDGTCLELTRDGETGENRLLVWGDGESSTGRVVDRYGSRFAPSEGAVLIPHLPERPAPYDSTAALFDAVAAFIAKYSGQGRDNAALLTFVCFASFFSESVSMSPSLLLFGPPIPAMSLLRVLQCVCRHGIVSAASSVRGLPPELRPTRFICQPDANIEKELAALQFHGVQSASAPREIHSATIIYAGDAELKTPFADVCFAVPIGLDAPSFSLQDERRETPTITRLQNQLLMYKLQNDLKVKSAFFDVPEFSGFAREFARTLGACIVDAPDLQARLVGLLRPQDTADRTRYAVTLDAIILEALVVACH